MTVAELKAALEGVPDNAEVVATHWDGSAWVTMRPNRAEYAPFIGDPPGQRDCRRWLMEDR